MERIKPTQMGESLLKGITTTHPATGQVAIWWLGQSGYAIKTASVTFYIDLYLSEHLTTKYANTDKPHTRMTEAPLRGADLADVSLVFATHKHSDHLDPGTMPDLMNASPDARLVLPLALADYAVETLNLPRERLLPTRGDETLELDRLKVHVIPSAHPGLDYHAETGYPFLGFLFEVDGVRLYHSGDTVVYDGLAGRLADFRPDIMFLPINGTSERLTALGTPPNMSAHDAVDLALEVGKPLVIPHHYDMFTFNTVDVSDFTTYADQHAQPYRVLHCGERFLWTKT